MHGSVTIFGHQYLGFSCCKAYKEACCKAINVDVVCCCKVIIEFTFAG
jgi:hypothetical protein